MQDSPPDEAAIWRAHDPDIDAFSIALGDDYQIVEVAGETDSESPHFAAGGGPIDARRYYLFHNGEVVGALDAMFLNGEFDYVMQEEAAVGQMPEGLQALWREKRGDLSAFRRPWKIRTAASTTWSRCPRSPRASSCRRWRSTAPRSLHWERGLAMRDRYCSCAPCASWRWPRPCADKYAMIDFLAELCNEMGNIYIAFEDYDAAMRCSKRAWVTRPTTW